jgi:hypothetical protein
MGISGVTTSIKQAAEGDPKCATSFLSWSYCSFSVLADNPLPIIDQIPVSHTNQVPEP